MFLVTTADRRFWKTGEKTLFLGEWCKLYSDRDTWSRMDYKVLPYHWNDRDRFQTDFSYLETTFEKYLILLAERLNAVHETNFSVRYWRILVGVWLRAFIDALYDRYLSIRAAQESGLVTDTWICSTEAWTPPDVPSFSHDAYNLFLYSRIIKWLGAFPFKEKRLARSPLETISTAPQQSRLAVFFTEVVRHLSKGPEIFLRQSIAVIFLEIYPRLIRRLRTKIVFAGSLYLPLWSQIRLQLSLGQLPYLYHGEKIRFAPRPIDAGRRIKLAFSASSDPFHLLLNELLPEQVPMVYIEYYREMHERVLAISPRAPQVAVTAFTINYRRCFEFWAAHHSEHNGTKLVITQHGGGYGIARYSALDNHFSKAFDRYYTWGSSLDKNPAVKVMPSFRLWKSRKSLNSSNPRGPIMWVATTVARYKTFAESGVVGPHMLDYIRDQRIFYQALGKEARDLLLWRYFGALWEDVERFKEFAPKLRTQHGLKRQLGKESNFISDLRKCRLAVHTANETTYLEALAANFPSIIFWDPRYYTVRESLQPLFDELASAEILHYTPESAAHKLTEIYRDPAEWWGRADVQEARRGFCAALARTSDDWLIQWREELRSLAG